MDEPLPTARHRQYLPYDESYLFTNISLYLVLQITNFGCLLVALWGMIGIWTTKVGYHNLWEFWFFNAQFGITMGAQFSYGQAFMAELVPRGREYMFFSLLGIVSKGSSWIGPIVCSAIVDANGNQVRFSQILDHKSFPFANLSASSNTDL